MEIKSIHPAVLRHCSNMFFRQSFVSDYLTCPQMSLYRWVLAIEEEQPFFAAFLGTAGHEVVFNMHVDKNFNMEDMEILEAFEYAFNKALDEAAELPRIANAYDSIKEQFDDAALSYVELIRGYQEDSQNYEFMSTLHEQLFVLELEDNIANEKFLFTGQIDQAGYYGDGTFSMRDLKFRANAFRPSWIEFGLNVQMTVYAAALKYGKPSCESCRPMYADGGELMYDGPCPNCEAKIGTPAWPQKFAERCELVWMRDYETRKKDKCQRYIKDPEKKKVVNPKTGRMVIREIENPKWAEGYKKGDFHGPGVITTHRTPAAIDVFMSDVIRICQQIRNGIFYRKPGNHCNFWCKYGEQCVRGAELDIEEANEEAAARYSTLDPFGEEG